MAFPLASLPEEILQYHIFPYLGVEDVLNLHQCVPFDFTRGLYERFFPKDPEFDNFDLERRAKAEVYIFGSTRYADPAHFEPIRLQNGYSTTYRMHTPVKADLTQAVVKVSDEGNRIYMLTTSGKVYFTEIDILQTHELAHQIKRPNCAMCRETHTNNIRPVTEASLGDLRAGNPFTGWEATQLDKQYGTVWDQIYKTYTEPFFVDITTNGTLMSALDRRGFVVHFAETPELWGEWWENVKSCSLPLFVQGENKSPAKVIKNKALKVRSNTVLFEDKGIAVLEGKQTDRLIDFIRLPRTGDVNDWVVLKKGIVFLRNDGTVDITRILRRGQMGFHRQLNDGPDPVTESNPLKEVNKCGPFKTLSSYYNRVALVTKTDEVIVCTAIWEVDPTPKYRFHVNGVIRLALGDMHYVALTSHGEVYVWGKEHLMNGCMGLGTLEEALERGATVETIDQEEYLVVAKPTKVKLPGRAYAISAGYKESAILVG